MEQAPEPTTRETPNSYGSVFSILLIVLVLVAGAFYVWNKRIHTTTPIQATEEVSPTLENTVSGE